MNRIETMKEHAFASSLHVIYGNMNNILIIILNNNLFGPFTQGVASVDFIQTLGSSTTWQK